MNSPFNERFISKSPLRKHKGLERKLKRVQSGKIGAEQGDIDYDLVADLQRQIEDAKAAHNSQRTEEEDTQVIEDEYAVKGSAIEMKSSPLHGYVDASDMVDPTPPTAHMWTKVFDAMSTAGVAIVDAKAKKENEKKFNEAAKGMDETSDEYKALYIKHYGPIKPKE